MTRIKDLPTFETLDSENWVAVDTNSEETESGKASVEVLSSYLSANLPFVQSVNQSTGISVNNSDPNNPLVGLSQSSQDALNLATTSVQPHILGGLAYQDLITVSNIDATGTPTSSSALFGDGVWRTMPGGGNMLSAVYDPQGISNDAFARENHTGTQPISATEGLQDALDNKLSEVPDGSVTFPKTDGSFGLAEYESRSIAAASIVPATAETLVTRSFTTPGDGGGGAVYVRVASEPTSYRRSFRTLDRFLPNGSVSPTNGGWWEEVASTIISDRSLAVPDGFGWTPPILPIHQNGRWKGTRSVRNMKPVVTGAEYFVHPIFGTDSLQVGKSFPITNVSKTNPARITVNGHGITSTGFSVYIQGLSQPRALNGRWFRILSIVSANQLEIQGEDGTGFPDFSGPGIAYFPIRSLNYALQRPDVAQINLCPGIYSRDKGFNNPALTTPSDGIVIRKWPIEYGPVWVTGALDVPVESWTQDPTYPNLWSTNVSNSQTIVKVVDASALDKHGVPRVIQRQRQAAISTMRSESAAGGDMWFIDPDTGALHIALPGDRRPDQTILLLNPSAVQTVSTDIHIHIEDISFIGGNEGFTPRGEGSSSSKLSMAGCSFMHGLGWGTGHGLRALGIAEIYLEDCIATANGNDGFNYHIHNGVIPKVVEVNCKGFDNGTTGTSNNNGSTVHNGITILRIGTEARGNEGPQIADVGGSLVWCVGCEGGSSSNLLGQEASLLLSGGAGWYYDCSADGAPIALALTNSAAAKVYAPHLDASASINIDSGSSLEPYVQQ